MLQHTTTRQSQDSHNNQADTRHVRPFRITWQGKSYEIKNVNDYHTATEGGLKVHIFTATDGAGTFELKFSSEEVAWFLGD